MALVLKKVLYKNVCEKTEENREALSQNSHLCLGFKSGACRVPAVTALQILIPCILH
jgi:hypothetical protein